STQFSYSALYNNLATTVIYTLSLRDALPISQALVGGDDDDADALHGVALDEERVPVLGVGVADVRGDVADLLAVGARLAHALLRDRKSTRLNSSHGSISYAVLCLKKKTTRP